MGGTDDRPLSGVGELDGRTVVVRRSSSFWDTLQDLRGKVPSLEVVAADERASTHDLLHRVATGEIDLTVADDNTLRAELRYRDDVQPLLDLTERRPVAWAVRPDSPALLALVNDGLKEARLGHHFDEPWFGDLPAIQERGVLRVLTRNNGATYFLHRGELLGFDYELVRRLAEHLGVRVQMTVPPNHGDLLDWLVEGRGDLVAAGLTVTPLRRAREGVAWSAPTDMAREVVVKRADDPLSAVDELSGRTVVVRRSSAYWETLSELREGGLAFTLLAASEDLETEAIIAGVADGTYNAGIGHVTDARRLAEVEGLDPNRWFEHTERAMLLLMSPRHYRRARHGYIRGTEPVQYVRKIRERYAAYVEATADP